MNSCQVVIIVMLVEICCTILRIRGHLHIKPRNNKYNELKIPIKALLHCALFGEFGARYAVPRDTPCHASCERSCARPHNKNQRGSCFPSIVFLQLGYSQMNNPHVSTGIWITVHVYVFFFFLEGLNWRFCCGVEKWIYHHFCIFFRTNGYLTCPQMTSYYTNQKALLTSGAFFPFIISVTTT